MVRRLLRRRGLVIAAAVVLALSVTAVAWAATGSDKGGNGSDKGRTCPACAPGHQRNEGGLGPGTPPERGFPDLKELRERLRERMKEDRALGKGLLRLIREKMSPEDQAKLDELLKQAEARQAEVRKAVEALRQTMKEIKDLVKKYLPPDEGESVPGGLPSGSGATS